MMKKAIFMVTLLLVGLFAMTSNAMATNVTFEMTQLLDWGRLYDVDGANWVPYNVNPRDGSEGVTLADGYAAPDYSNTDEDSFGVFKVSYILNNDSNTYMYQDSDPGNDLVVLFQNFSDVAISGDEYLATILSQGGQVDLYSVPAGTYDMTTAGDASAFPLGIDSNTLLLNMTPKTQLYHGVNYTMKNVFDFSNLTGSGYGMLLDVNSGAWASMYDTNTKTAGADMVFNFHSQPVNNGEWIVTGGATAQANVVPEPASMILMGLGLLGATRLRRKTA